MRRLCLALLCAVCCCSARACNFDANGQLAMAQVRELLFATVWDPAKSELVNGIRQFAPLILECGRDPRGLQDDQVVELWTRTNQLFFDAGDSGLDVLASLIPDEELMSYALGHLQTLGPKAVPWLEKSLPKLSRWPRWRTIECLAMIGSGSHDRTRVLRIARDLVSLFASPSDDDGVTAEAMMSLLPADPAVKVIQQAARTGPARVRAFAIKALAQLPDKSSVPLLLRFANSTLMSERRGAAYALGVCPADGEQRPAVSRLLRSLLRSSDPELASIAMLSARRKGFDWVPSEAHRLAHSPVPMLRIAAHDALSDWTGSKTG